MANRLAIPIRLLYLLGNELRSCTALIAHFLTSELVISVLENIERWRINMLWQSVPRSDDPLRKKELSDV
jgi:hypothetical protein